MIDSNPSPSLSLRSPTLDSVRAPGPLRHPLPSRPWRLGRRAFFFLIQTRFYQTTNSSPSRGFRIGGWTLPKHKIKASGWAPAFKPFIPGSSPSIFPNAFRLSFFFGPSPPIGRRKTVQILRSSLGVVLFYPPTPFPNPP